MKLLHSHVLPNSKVAADGDPTGKAKRKRMVIAVAISPAELGPSPDPMLESLAASCDDGVGVAVEAFVKMAASGELGDSPSRPVQTERHNAKLAYKKKEKSYKQS